MQKNIFGKTPFDYKYLVDAKNSDPLLYDYYIKKGFTGRGHHFNALGNGMGIIKDKNSLRDSEAQAITYLTSNTEAMQAEIEEIMYGQFRLDDLFPFNTNIPEGAQTYYYRVVNSYGKAKFIDNMGTNADNATISTQKVSYNLRQLGVVPQWSDEDLRGAVFANIPFDTYVMKAATESCIQEIERVGLGIYQQGGVNTNPTFEGLLNLSSVTVDTAAAQWNTLTPDEVVEAITNPIANIIKNSEEIFGRNIKAKLALYCSVEMANFLMTPRQTYDAKSIWEYARINNVWNIYTGIPLEMRIVTNLSTAGADGENRVIYGYPESSEVWEMGMSISPRVLPTIRQPYGYVSPMEAKISGLNVKRPGGLLYVDNVYLAS